MHLINRRLMGISPSYYHCKYLKSGKFLSGMVYVKTYHRKFPSYRLCIDHTIHTVILVKICRKIRLPASISKENFKKESGFQSLAGHDRTCDHFPPLTGPSNHTPHRLNKQFHPLLKVRELLCNKERQKHQ